MYLLQQQQAQVFGLGQRLEMPYEKFKSWADRLQEIAIEIGQELHSS